ncbi:glycine zipper 2TM domain-containing protein [Alcanivorax sp. JB21]|uniref:glycine zipper 2TM domain-containing protein n=1 Tax=Alcanivorax limicola TaxID=2874102 RepID=UPI001CBD6BE3|nr:glycine zipper 2TM domain-containing protein [Alcanivorax limicola]MBZ2188366.1 glycine zipper 2TM domain-containing protein [Alcanivorax limicola]
MDKTNLIALSAAGIIGLSGVGFGAYQAGARQADAPVAFQDETFHDETFHDKKEPIHDKVADQAVEPVAPAAPTLAHVLNVEPISRSWQVPREDCHVVEVQRQAPITSEHNTAGTLIGAVVGGVLGNQVGGGNGKKVATAAGILAGGYTGNRIQDNQQRSRTYTTTELQCSTVYDTRSETTGYTVTYLLGDERGSVRMDHRPGDTLPVRDGQVVIR